MSSPARRDRFFAGTGTSPAPVLRRGRYFAGAGTSPGPVGCADSNVVTSGRGGRTETAGTSPTPVLRRGRYFAGAGTSPGPVHAPRLYFAGPVLHRGMYFTGAGTMARWSARSAGRRCGGQGWKI
eukprot:gene13721-biopygen3536